MKLLLAAAPRCSVSLAPCLPTAAPALAPFGAAPPTIEKTLSGPADLPRREP